MDSSLTSFEWMGISFSGINKGKIFIFQDHGILTSAI